MIKVGFFNLINRTKQKGIDMEYVKMMNGYILVFSQFGNSIHASDTVQNAISIICNGMSELCPKHIRTDPEDEMQTIINGELNRLLKYEPNSLMTTSDFISKIVFQYKYNKDAFIYPTYDKIMLDDNRCKRYYIGLWPLSPSLVEFLEDTTGKLFIKFYFADGELYILPYEDVIHWRRSYSLSDFTGGDETGSPNSKDLLKLLNTNDTALQGIGTGVKASFTARGVIKINTLLDDEKQEEERAKFEEKMKNTKSGILPIDNEGDYIPITVDPKSIDKDTMESVDSKILAHYGASRAIFNEDFTGEQYQAYHEKKLESMAMSPGRAFTKALFTQRELEIGHEIICYQQGLMYMNTNNKIDVVDMLTRIGTLTDNQVLGTLRYPLFEGRNIKRMSLNYINRDIADQYQLQKSVTKGREGKSE